MATKDQSGANLPAFDGSTWDPFARQLLFTAESGAPNGGVWQKTLDRGTPAVDLRGILDSSGYEGIQNDSAGNLWIVEDSGGTTVGHARQPNSFVYRFVPKDRTDLMQGGKLQVLQVESLANPGEPIVFHDGQAAADISSQDTTGLHTYGHTFDTRWITIHDTDTDGSTTPFNSNPLEGRGRHAVQARGERRLPAAHPVSRIRVHRDRRHRHPHRGGRGRRRLRGIQMLEQTSPSANEGRLHLLVQGDPEHAAFDNISWLTDRTVAAVEDRGDTFQGQGNGEQPTALDSGWAIDATVDHSKTTAGVTRFLAEGRDPSTWELNPRP